MQRRTFERETRRVVRVHVARRAAPADHRVFLVRLEVGAAEQRGVLVALEVRQAHDDRPRPERRGDRAHPLAEPLDEVGRAVGVLRRQRAHRRAHALVADALGLQQRHRVGLDRLADDELHARQADAVAGHQAGLEGQLGVAEVDHDLGGRALQAFERGDVLVKRQRALVDAAHRALGARHGDKLAVGQQLAGALGADHRRDAELARDDGRMAGAPAAVGDDGRGGLHDRLPVGRGGVGDQHLAGLEAAQRMRADDAAHRSAGDLGADRAALHAHAAGGVEHVLLEHVGALARGRRLGAGLHDVERPVGAVLGPLDVHRPAVMVLDRDRRAGEFEHVGVAQAVARAHRPGRRAVDHGLARAPAGVDHLHLLVAQRAAHDGAVALAVGRLVHVELVGVDSALHDVLAQPPGRGDEDEVGVAALGVDSEDHAAAGQVAAHHLLHADRQVDPEVVEALVAAVADRAVGEQRGLTAPHGIDQHLLAAHVEVGVVLAGEAGGRQVLGGGRAAHRDAEILAELRLERAPGRAQLLLDRRRHRSAVDDLSRARAGPRQGVGVALVEPVEQRVQFGPDAGSVERVAVGLRGDGKAVGHAHAQPRQALEHLAERGILAADQRQVGERQLAQPADVGGLGLGHRGLAQRRVNGQAAGRIVGRGRGQRLDGGQTGRASARQGWRARCATRPKTAQAQRLST